MPAPSPIIWRRSHAFTLIELLVVIVILGILMAVAVPTFLRQQSKAQDSRTQQYLTTAFKAIRAGLPDTNNQYPQSTSMVSWIQQSEPELTAQRGDCLNSVTSAPVDAVLVDPASSANALTLCARSQSGNVYKLTATATGVQSLVDGTLVPFSFSGKEITDATRAAGIQGDGRSSPDSSTGIWAGATNLIRNGGAESNTTNWLSANGLGTLTRDNARAKFGSWSVRYDAAGNNSSWSAGIYQPTAAGLNGTTGTTYTASIWVSGAAGKQLELLMRFHYTDTTAQDFVVPFTGADSWTRYTVTATVPAGETVDSIDDQVRPYNLVVDSTFGPWTVWVDGAQVEQGAAATPYIETNGTTATRSNARVQAPSSVLNATQGWVALRVRMGYSSSALPDTYSGIFGWGTGGTGTDDVSLFRSSLQWRLERDAGGTGTSVWSGALTWNNGDYYTVIGAWTGTQVEVSANGASFATAANTNVPSLTSVPTFDIGSGQYENNALRWANGDVLWFACGTGTLSNADAATINGWGNSDPKRSSFPSSAQATLVWDGTSSSGSLR